MTPELLSTLKKCYSESGKNKELFFELALKESGLQKQAFDRGALFDLIDTLIWENKTTDK